MLGSALRGTFGYWASPDKAHLETPIAAYAPHPSGPRCDGSATATPQGEKVDWHGYKPGDSTNGYDGATQNYVSEPGDLDVQCAFCADVLRNHWDFVHDVDGANPIPPLAAPVWRN